MWTSEASLWRWSICLLIGDDAAQPRRWIFDVIYQSLVGIKQWLMINVDDQTVELEKNKQVMEDQAIRMTDIKFQLLADKLVNFHKWEDWMTGKIIVKDRVVGEHRDQSLECS